MPRFGEKAQCVLLLIAEIAPFFFFFFFCEILHTYNIQLTPQKLSAGRKNYPGAPGAGVWPEDQVMHRGRKTRPPPVLGGPSPLSIESKKKDIGPRRSRSRCCPPPVVVVVVVAYSLLIIPPSPQAGPQAASPIFYFIFSSRS